MKFNSVAVVGMAATASAVAPQGGPPAGCSSSSSGTFEITARQVVQARSLQERTDLVLTLENGVLKDAVGRIGYIASNYQFQFDNPVQPGTIFDSGFSACGNGSIGLGPTTVFWECISNGVGSSYNLYDRAWAPGCIPVEIIMIDSTGSGAATQSPDGQPQVSSAAVVTQKTDGQPNAPTGVPVTEKTDGQPNAPTGAPITEKTDGQPNAPTGAPVTEKTDGQPNAPTPTGAPITEKTDGQPNAPTATAPPVTEKTDGQPNAPTGPPVTEKTDGQPNAPTGAPVTEKTDGQPNAPVPTAPAGNSTLAIIPTPVPSTVPSTVPASSGNRALPSCVAGLLIAGLSAVLYL